MTSAPRSRLTDAEKVEFVREHLQYELDMLHWAAGVLRQPAEANVHGGLRNAAIEVFCLHARNLHEFFGGTPAETRDRCASARHFAIKAYRPGRLDKDLESRLNSHNSHLTYRRVSLADKINGADLHNLSVYIDEEMVRFMSNLRPEIRQALDQGVGE